MSSARYTSLVVTAAVSVLLARVLPIEDRGRYAVVVSLGSLLALGVTAGLDTLTLRATSPGAVRSTLASALRRAGQASILAFVISVVAIVYTSRTGIYILALSPREIAAGCVAAPLIVISQLLGNMCIAAQRTLVWVSVTIGNTVIYATGAAVVSVAGVASVTAFALVLAGGYLLSSVSYIVTWRRHISLRDVLHGPEQQMRAEEYSAAVPAVVQLLLLRLQVPILHSVAGPAAAGLMAVALSVVEMALVFPVTIGAALLPHFNARQANRKEVRRHAAITFIATGIVSAVLALSAPILVPVAFGEPYRDSVFLVQVMSVGIAAFAYARVTQSYFYAQGRFSEVAWASSLALGASMAIQLTFGWRHGAAAAAVAVSLAYVILTLVLSFADSLGSRHD